MKVTGCAASEEHPVCEVTVDGPFGPITLRTEYTGPTAAGAPGKFYSMRASSICHSVWNGGWPSYWYEMWTTWSCYGYWVLGVQPTIYEDHSIPMWGWDDHRTWTDYEDGWQWAWGNVRTDLTYGWPASFDIASLHMNQLLSYDGTCQGDAWFNWF